MLIGYRCKVFPEEDGTVKDGKTYARRVAIATGIATGSEDQKDSAED